jgi:nitrate/nitrite transport system substrate-binding protein
MEAGTIHGYCVGELWNQQAVAMGIGVPVVTSYPIWKNNPEKVFGVSSDWAEKYLNTHIAVVKALIHAAKWLDANDNANRVEAVEILSRSYYVGADAEVIANSMTGTFEYEKGDMPAEPDFNVFFRHHATYPFYSDAIWFLTQMRRWGQIPEGKMQASEFPDFASEDGMRDVASQFINWLEPFVRLAKGENRREYALDVFNEVGLPLIVIGIFLLLWAGDASQVKTSLGELLGPVRVWQQAGNTQ